MDDSKYTFEYLERYLAGELPVEEQNLLEKAIEKDTALAERVKRQKMTHKAVQLFAQTQTRERVRQIFDKTQPGSAGRGLRILRIAASIAIVLALGLSYLYLAGSLSDETIAVKYFEAYPDRFTTMSSGSDTPLAQAMADYERKNWESALKQFDALSDSLQQTSLVNLYRGVATLGSGQAQEASVNLSALLSNNDDYSEPARWYLALALLQIGETDQAAGHLQEIVDNNAYQADNAARILKRLNNPLRKLPGIK